MYQSGLSVLHVEDDNFDAALIEEMLREGSGANNIRLNRVNNIKSAVSDLCKNKYNVILLDLLLGDVSGVKNVEIIHEQSPDTAIVVLTGMEGDETAIKALRAGAQEFLVKAYENPYALKYAIRSAIERKEFEKELYKKANHDILTGLPNFRFLQEQLASDLAKAKRWKKELAIMFIDIHKFKQINDELGHENGNLVIVEVSKRIKSTLRSSDFVSRYGGDEFAIILDMQDSCIKTGCSRVAGKIFHAMQEPIKVEGAEVLTHLNIGFSIYPNQGSEPKDLLEEADKAMYSSKHAGPNTYKFA